MLLGQSKWKRGRLTEFLFQEGLIYGIWFRNPICTLFNTVFICLPSDSTVSEDAGIEPRTVATLAMAVRRTNHSARSHPLELAVDLIHNQYHTDTVALPPQPNNPPHAHRTRK
jgi:hypothetical protein